MEVITKLQGEWNHRDVCMEDWMNFWHAYQVTNKPTNVYPVYLKRRDKLE
jgi:hypothetical protein